ncbi:MBL fold metallo-hydrolase [Candidatus Parcubacteria bacterium]|nr:MBL fold metallo-hydrolase [Patescibacteria group bacterium]MBU4482033.1 MBL fold metallo-hydrolase [Patescibacteria group bacterium]MCG2686651.1 MBL fold metallo-hydrolase [Candidatus Parcubacteria bacterium]
MTINWFGQSFFKITTKNSNGEDVVIAIDPFNKDYGLKVPTKFDADIVLISHDHKDHNNVDLIKGANLSPEPFVISGPGEYEIKGVMVYGIPAFHDDKQGAERGEITMFLIESEGIWLAHLSDLGQKTLENGQLEQLQSVDILMIPVGGVFTIDAKDASNIISQIEPRVIIPMHYKLPDLKLDIDNVDKFIKEQGLTPEEIEGKLKINKKDLPDEDTKLFVMKN